MPLHWARKRRHSSRPLRAPSARGRAETSPTLAGKATPACVARADSRAGVSSPTSRWTSSRSRSAERWLPDSQRLAQVHQAP
eukprot:2995220-Alexandrium_andersonii.AAC.1